MQQQQQQQLLLLLSPTAPAASAPALVPPCVRARADSRVVATARGSYLRWEAFCFQPRRGAKLGVLAQQVGQAGQVAPVPVLEVRVAQLQPVRVCRRIRVSCQPGLYLAITLGTQLHRPVGVAPGERRAVGHTPVVHQVHTGVEAVTRRPTGHRLVVMVREAHTFFREAINGWRAHEWVAGTAQAVGTQLIGGDEEQIWAAPAR
jgi:hypothetical protein